MEYRRIADGRLEVSTVCLGCWSMVGDRTWGPQAKTDAIAAIRASLECGVNFLDTAEMYGDGLSERYIGEALGGDRDRVVIASKVAGGHLSAEALPAACEASLRNLGTDYLDVYYIHWPGREVPFEETVRAMEKLVEAGKVRHVAVSNFGAADLAAITPLARPAVDQLSYSLLFRAIEHEILPACRAAGVPAACYSPLMQGLLTGKFASADEVPAGRARTRLFSKDRPESRHGEAGAEAETFEAVAAVGRIADEAGLDMPAMSLAWLLGVEGVAGVIAGARNAEQARANAAAADLKLPADVARRLDEATAPLKAALGPNPDLWQTESRIR
jgi:aryl-alcohol dehydrogenase-like predicted oxidoreductase